MSDLHLLSAYKSFFSGELKHQEALRKSAKTALISSVDSLSHDVLTAVCDQNLSDVAWWKDVCELPLSLVSLDVTNVDTAMEEIRKTAAAAIERKQNNITMPLQFTQDENDAFAKWSNIEAQLQAYNDAIDVANKSITAFQDSIGSTNLNELEEQLRVLECHARRYNEDVVSAYLKYDEALRQRNVAQEEKTKANEALRQSSENTFNTFGKAINDILGRFAVGFEVGDPKVNLRGGIASGHLTISLKVGSATEAIDCTAVAATTPAKASLSNTLSGGDRSALALAYFLATLQIESGLESAVVVVDDPYNGQDRSRRLQTLTLLSEIAKRSGQFFLFSHDLDFAHDFYAQKDIDRHSIRSFAIKPFDTPTILCNSELPPSPSKAYETHYQELIGYSQNPSAFSGELLEIAGRIRPVLETYFRYKYPTSWGDKDYLGRMIEIIRAAHDCDTVAQCKSLVSDMDQVCKYTNPFHHGATGSCMDVIDPVELKTHVDIALRIIHHA